jgi:hypothetical protein
MSQASPRPIVASWYRKGKIVTVRHYARLDTSIPTITRNLILDGEPVTWWSSPTRKLVCGSEH